jgi:hypothetical protein
VQIFDAIEKYYIELNDHIRYPIASSPASFGSNGYTENGRQQKEERAMKRERRGSPAATAAFRRFATMVILLRKRGLPDEEIDLFVQKKVLADLAKAEAELREASLKPSLN